MNKKSGRFDLAGVKSGILVFCRFGGNGVLFKTPAFFGELGRGNGGPPQVHPGKGDISGDLKERMGKGISVQHFFRSGPGTDRFCQINRS